MRFKKVTGSQKNLSQTQSEDGYKTSNSLHNTTQKINPPGDLNCNSCWQERNQILDDTQNSTAFIGRIIWRNGSVLSAPVCYLSTISSSGQHYQLCTCNISPADDEAAW